MQHLRIRVFSAAIVAVAAMATDGEAAMAHPNGCGGQSASIGSFGCADTDMARAHCLVVSPHCEVLPAVVVCGDPVGGFTCYWI